MAEGRFCDLFNLPWLRQIPIVKKLGIVLKELSETRYWLKVLIKSKLIPEKRIENLFSEADELCKIIGKSVITVKKKQSRCRR